MTAATACLAAAATSDLANSYRDGPLGLVAAYSDLMAGLYEVDAPCEKCGAVLTAAGLPGSDPLVTNRYSFDCPFCSTVVELATPGVDMALTRYQRPPNMFRRKLRHR